MQITDPIRERIAAEVASFGSKEIVAMLLYPAALVPWGILTTIFLLLLPPQSPLVSITVLTVMAAAIFVLDAWLVNVRLEDQIKRGFWMIHLRQSILFYGIVATGIAGFLGFGKLGASLKEGPLSEEGKMLFMGLALVCVLAIVINGIVLALLRRRVLIIDPSVPSSPPSPGIS